MSNKSLAAFCLAITLLVFAGCATVKTQDSHVQPPPQNLLGYTDQLQLVAEFSMDLARKYGGDRVLVVLEVDNTLLIGEQGAECSGSTMQPAQADAQQQVQRMQDAGLKVIVMTARGPECRTQTLRELDRNGFSLQASAWPPKDGYVDPFLPAGGDRQVTYENGVFLTAGQDKGLMLKALLEKSDAADPLLIVMADHQQDDLNAVMKAFTWSGTKVHAWRYTRVNQLSLGKSR